MSGAVRRGEIRLYGFDAPDKRRPVPVLTRPEVTPLRMVEQSRLGRYLGSLSPETMVKVCRAIALPTGYEA